MESGRGRVLIVMWRVAVLALCLTLVLKWGVVDGFEVRGNSMEPLLRDRRPGPDHVMVFKRHFDLFEPARFDLVVFERPDAAAFAALPSDLVGDRFVKRLVAHSGERILLEDGDLFVGPAGEPLPTRPVDRPLALLAAMDVDVATLDPANPASTPWVVPGNARVDGDAIEIDATGDVEGDGRLRYQEFVTDDWVDEGGRVVRGETRVNDTGLRFGLTLLDGETRVIAELREKGDTFRLTLAAGEELALERLAGPRRIPLDAGRTAPLPVGRALEVEFRNVDDRLLVLVDGTLVVDVRYDGNTEVSGMASRNEPSLVVPAGRARVTGLTVTRDVYYTENGCDHAVRAPYTVPEGEAFLLGDNSVNSRDSRHFGSVPLTRFVGRPFLVFRPFARWRVL